MENNILLNRLLGDYAEMIQPILEKKQAEIFGGNIKGRKYRKTLEALPEIKPSSIDVLSDRVRIGRKEDITPEEKNNLLHCLRQLNPWRKGPFQLFGIDIDTEWRSDMKWNRLKDHIAPLAHKRILDIGSSNGYYMFKMASQQPECVIGIEPYLTFYFQYHALQTYLQFDRLCCLPLKIEEMPVMKEWFDTVFCMGILYHRRSPLDMLLRIRSCLKTGGELVLETLILEGDADLALVPENRYAKMNNVYFIPTVPCLRTWLVRTGFHHIRCIDITRTTSEEQHRTEWVDTESLEDFLDDRDPNKTVEGYPSPVRAIILADAK
ncbi:MAG: tRNA 5-methoxyuridine(34)/uridine 5-oxyacetic acid(34) synthase CmoB [Desulfobacteraceae bacterium]|nr:MAG: tRNA 5-methoxyuridine(34)/uridine 5-oxyacetic acid(34) synthase CmoB [Desulfobacteraceae bacterium]